MLLCLGVLVNGPYALITTAVSADLGTHPSLRGNARALATVTAIIDGTGSIGMAGFVGQSCSFVLYGWNFGSKMYLYVYGLNLCSFFKYMYMAWVEFINKCIIWLDFVGHSYTCISHICTQEDCPLNLCLSLTFGWCCGPWWIHCLNKYINLYIEQISSLYVIIEIFLIDYCVSFRCCYWPAVDGVDKRLAKCLLHADRL